MGSPTIHSDPPPSSPSFDSTSPHSDSLPGPDRPPLPPSSSPVITSSQALDWIDGLTLVSHVLPSPSPSSPSPSSSAQPVPDHVRANLHAISSHIPNHHHHHHSHTRPFAAVLVSDVYTHVIAAGLASLSRPGHVRLEHVSVVDAYQGLGIGSHVAKTLVDVATRGLLLPDEGAQCNKRRRGRGVEINDMDLRVKRIDEGMKQNIGFDERCPNVSVSVVSTEIAVSLFSNLGFLPSSSLKSTLLTRQRNSNTTASKRTISSAGTSMPDITLVGHYDVTYLPLSTATSRFILPDHFSVCLLRDTLRYYRAVVNDTTASPLIEHSGTTQEHTQQYVAVVRHRGSGAVVGAVFGRQLNGNGHGRKRFFIGPVVADTVQVARHGVRILCERLEDEQQGQRQGQEIETEIEMRTLDVMPMRSFELVWMGCNFDRQEELTYMHVTKSVNDNNDDDGEDDVCINRNGTVNGQNFVDDAEEIDGRRAQCQGELELVDTKRYFCLDR